MSPVPTDNTLTLLWQLSSLLSIGELFSWFQVY